MTVTVTVAVTVTVMKSSLLHLVNDDEHFIKKQRR
jgi:hypothetical protein